MHSNQFIRGQPPRLGPAPSIACRGVLHSRPPRILVSAQALKAWQVERLQNASAKGKRNISVSLHCQLVLLVHSVCLHATGKEGLFLYKWRSQLLAFGLAADQRVVWRPPARAGRCAAVAQESSTAQRASCLVSQVITHEEMLCFPPSPCHAACPDPGGPGMCVHL